MSGIPIYLQEEHTTIGAAEPAAFAAGPARTNAAMANPIVAARPSDRPATKCLCISAPFSTARCIPIPSAERPGSAVAATPPRTVIGRRGRRPLQPAGWAARMLLAAALAAPGDTDAAEAPQC